MRVRPRTLPYGTTVLSSANFRAGSHSNTDSAQTDPGEKIEPIGCFDPSANRRAIEQRTAVRILCGHLVQDRDFRFPGHLIGTADFRQAGYISNQVFASYGRRLLGIKSQLTGLTVERSVGAGGGGPGCEIERVM